MCIVLLAEGIIKQLKVDGCVLGITSVDDEMFLLLYRVENQVPVHSIKDHRLLRHLNIPGYKPNYFSDMTACERRRCLYMSDNGNYCIRRYDLAHGAAPRWVVSGSPVGLSLTPSGNLLVTCDEPNKLVELSGDSGPPVREITLQADIESLSHSVQLTTGQFIFCFGLTDLHQVCVVGDDGKATMSYGGKPGSDVGQLNCPCHLAVDKESQSIFVADRDNHRVVMLSPTLESVRCISEKLPCPLRLYFHDSKQCLYVGHLHIGDVTIIQL